MAKPDETNSAAKLKTNKGANAPLKTSSQDFRPETIDEITRIISVEWFPPVDVAPHKKPKPASLVTGYEGSLVDAVNALATKARANDRDALLRLFVITSAAQLQMWKLAKERPDLVKQAAANAFYWPIPFSSVPMLNNLFSQLGNMLNIGRLILNLTKAKGNLQVPAKACAFKLLSYMVLARRGLIRDERYTRWEEACVDLKPLGEDTWKGWWELGKQVARDMFPDLADIIYADAGGSYGDAVHRLCTTG